MGCRVELTPSELMLAAMAGVMREVQNLKNGSTHRYGCPKADGFRRNIEGCIGELVLAKFLQAYWAGKGTLGSKDVAGQQVRCAQPGGALILHPSDADADRFWLVRGEAFDYVVEGWIAGRAGKSPQWWEPQGRGGNGRAAFFVPVDALNQPQEVAA